jgi:glycosyltransferase involved in cell wall biosynthesis
MASFESIYEIDKDISLDIYSSFEIYGWKDRDKPYEKLFEKAKNHEGIRYHGYQPNEVVRKALKKSHIFAYPCTWSETSCISAIEALCSGNVVICPRYGALPETCGMFGIYYDFSPSNVDHANTFVNVLYKSILAMRNQGLNTEFQQMLYNKFYDWKTNAHLWKNILEDK